jgi:hypothetical protein
MPEGIEHWLPVELVAAGGVHDDGRIDKVADPVGPALLVQRQVPVDPADGPKNQKKN